ncbi:hypothetical protein BD311DRAFT_780441 [Dichomitus squalens]|uniref:DUF1212-domain-containing protein n=1 Tax=Dichomitus squalens TaxID=114155 RepID=A0A4Q9MH88_9APHY|nr:hypothetical protein BD311DRAFT_780441 [Dichomitus squalens]
MDTPPNVNGSGGSDPASAQPDTRPPGGTRRSGNKTPRRVQWIFEEGQATTSPRALDEHGLDPEAFETLTHALERHRSSSIDGGHITPPLSNRLSTAMSPGTSLPSSPTTEAPSLHNVPGEAFIDGNETAGLPGRDIEQYSQAQAQKVLRAHKYNFFKSRGKHRHRRSESQPDAREEYEDKGKKSRRGFFRDRGTSSDVEKTAEARGATTPRTSQPTGVLSALLSMYEHTSGLTSRSSFDDSRTASLYNGPSSATSSAIAMPPPPAPARTEGYFPPQPQPQASTSTASLRPPNHPWTRVPFGNGRPPKSRGGAGVFGPLIAGTGNITGVAAPVSATVAPDLKRPGYHLSRYSLDEGKVPRVGAAGAGERKSLTRSRSVHSLRSPVASGPPTPGSEETVSPQHSTGGSQSPTSTNKRWSGVLKDLPKFSGRWTPSTMPSTPATDVGVDEWHESAAEEKKEKRRKRKKAEIWITRHVAEIVCRQEFILKLTRAMMMFGGPTHRLQAQIKATAKVLDIELSCMYLPDMMLISFDDAATGTSNIKFIRQGSALDIGKLQEAHELYWKVIHDDISVKDASVELDELMRRRPLYRNWQIVLIGGACSASICSVSFNGSFIDSLVSFPLGCLLILIQFFAARNELYSNIFEITVATFFSFIAAALSSLPFFCYSAIASSSVVLILPGFIVLCGSLELSSRNIVSGAVRVCFACIYSLFLGFGLAIGATAYSKLTNRTIAGSDDLTCGLSHDPSGPWWQRTPSLWWAFLTVPAYSLFLSLRQHTPWNRRELYLLVVISCIGWVTNHFTGTRFRNRNDISAAVGALAVGLVSNLYGRFFYGSAFVVMITGILFQLPSGLANGGLFTFVQQQTNGSSTNESYLSGFQTALQLISVSIGLTVGLGISLVLVHPIPSRRRAAGLFTL